MRVYFIFQMKEEYKNLYKGKESSLYQILMSIYKLDNEEVEYGYNLLKQMTIPINKEEIDRDLFVKLHREYPYSKREGIHYYNQLYKDEVSRLIVKNCYIKLEADNDTSSFFYYLKDFSDNFFVCDFNNRFHCFFLDEKSCKCK